MKKIFVLDVIAFLLLVLVFSVIGLGVKFGDISSHVLPLMKIWTMSQSGFRANYWYGFAVVSLVFMSLILVIDLISVNLKISYNYVSLLSALKGLFTIMILTFVSVIFIDYFVEIGQAAKIINNNKVKLSIDARGVVSILFTIAVYITITATAFNYNSICKLAAVLAKKQKENQNDSVN
ncbi:hypothetical protein [Spiroplasma sp. BIUS-1]|uniref:hypothetical protein n=1 Tax=Spiroplasma sp. BIUS-1 TaxID=216964 RepID=UPI001396FFA7|nr:hypothetical protein [Spiroplasma sp. BIUS-1]QHX36374.1 hypothetical protein SBIUS_v1c01210 [Spiroplasma sp. BIUS-1]